MLNRILAFSAVVEIATGLALLIQPALVIRWLLGVGDAGLMLPLARFLGIALLALGLACWPGTRRPEVRSPPFLGMLTYNGLVASFLAYLSAAEHVGGILLWPAVGLHAVVALLLFWTRTREGLT